MAEYANLEDWRFDLNSHPIFEKLRSNPPRNGRNERINPENLIFVNDGQIYVWDNDAARLLTANLRDVLVQEQAHQCNTLQVLLCINAPVFDVEHIIPSLCGENVLLYGRKGASVLVLPRRHGKHGLFEGGKAQINCRITPIAERLFISNTSLCLLKAAWYPGSENDMHLSILTSDNYFRLYDITSPLKPVQTHRLGSHATSFALSSSHSTFDAALGEIAITFDYGPPSLVQANTVYRGAGSESFIYPVFILRGNGDIYVLNTSLTDVRYSHTKLLGPLPMHPPAEDNYGMDACSLCCLESQPPVLVVATTSGLLHHCILVAGETDADDDSTSIHSGDTSSIASLGPGDSEFSLYVYETVELTRCPVTVEDYDSDISYPIMLHSDPSSCKRYFCSHSGGVHSVILAWLDKLEKFCSNGGDEEEETIHEVNQDHPCILRHMICTMPSETCAPSPILGVAVIIDQLLGNNLICLTHNRECMSTPLVPIEASTPPPLMSEGRGDEPPVSPLRQANPEPFQKYIKRLLQRNHSNPILKTSSKTQLNLDECFQLLLRATKTLREEYIHKQDTVKEEIEKRVKILKQQKQQQLADLAECQQLKGDISIKAEELAERYSDAEEKQEELLNRVGVVLHTLQSQLPILSEAEQGMRTELESMQNKIEHLKTSLKQVKAKNIYQQKYAEKQQKIKAPPSLSQAQEKQLKSLLKEQTEEIATLISEVQNISIAVGP
ncbi:nuclear pore complex protein Nup88-like [Lytechinus variegatus]|uniref:nuclear pore complex protein Nup88-like n=1 Tax=Lytechinus variegatus TaxID=7654 RepID=UPI001BB157A1|nr:nuclear pore complex protein Nup88-like [Lytechinus variegatus]